MHIFALDSCLGDSPAENEVSNCPAYFQNSPIRVDALESNELTDKDSLHRTGAHKLMYVHYFLLSISFQRYSDGSCIENWQLVFVLRQLLQYQLEIGDLSNNDLLPSRLPVLKKFKLKPFM